MRRREFIASLGGAAMCPIAARAQPSAMPVIGFLNGEKSSEYAKYVAAFRQGLNETGIVEGQNARRLFDLNGAAKTVSTKHSSAIMVR